MLEQYTAHERCHIINNSFFRVLENDELAACFMLGNLLLAINDANDVDKPILNETLNALKQKLTLENVQALWDKVFSISEIDFGVMENISQKSLNELKVYLLREEDLVKNLNEDKLISDCANDQLYGHALIAVLEKHAENNTHQNQHAKIDHHLVDMGDVENNFLYLSQNVQQYTELPVDAIAQLGATSEIASGILKYLTNHGRYFNVSQIFAENYSEMRKSIATTWQQNLELYPIEPSEESIRATQVNEMQQKYPEFSQVSLDSRIKKNYQSVMVEKPERGGSFEKVLAIGAGIASGIKTYEISHSALASCALVPTFIPAGILAFGVGVGIGCAVKRHCDYIKEKAHLARPS